MAVLFLFCCGNLFAASGAEPLLSDLDIPLMPGFVEDEDSRVVFDTPEGRIIQVQAMGSIGAQQAFEYYQLVLPSLAWAKISKKKNDTVADGAACNGLPSLCFMARRDGETLILRIIESKTGTVLYFSVNPE